MEPEYFQDKLGQWVCWTCDREHGYVPGIGDTKQEARKRWEEYLKRGMK